MQCSMQEERNGRGTISLCRRCASMVRMIRMAARDCRTACGNAFFTSSKARHLAGWFFVSPIFRQSSTNTLVQRIFHRRGRSSYSQPLSIRQSCGNAAQRSHNCSSRGRRLVHSQRSGASDSPRHRWWIAGKPVPCATRWRTASRNSFGQSACTRTESPGWCVLTSSVAFSAM